MSDPNTTYIPVPDPFLDVLGDRWRLSRAEGPQEVGLVDILLHTVRRLPVHSMEDSERGLSLITAIRRGPDSDGRLGLPTSDLKWMLHLLENNIDKTIWSPIDLLFLIRWLEQNST